MKRVRVRTQTQNVICERRERRAFPVCAVCKQQMHGVPINEDVAKTEKRTSRAYGGYMCATCSKEFFREQARSI